MLHQCYIYKAYSHLNSAAGFTAPLGVQALRKLLVLKYIVMHKDILFFSHIFEVTQWVTPLRQYRGGPPTGPVLKKMIKDLN